MRTLLSILFMLLFTATLTAQTWQWGKRGGSTADDAQGTNKYNGEGVYDMASDKNGNVYVASEIIGYFPTLGSYPTASYTQLNTFNNPAYPFANILITSYNCSGVLRWKKVIGGNGGDCFASVLRADTFGHIYVMGNVREGAHFDNDTTLPAAVEKRYFLLQYDTSGNFKWLRMPEADTTTHASGTGQLIDMELDGAGNPNIISFFPHSALSGSTIVIPVAGAYILRYSPLGALLSATSPAGFSLPPTINSYYNGTPYSNAQFDNFRMVHAPNGNWILAGQFDLYDSHPADFLINGQPLNHTSFIAAFDSQWQHLWHYSIDSFADFEGRPAADAAGNIYLTGGVQKNQVLFGDTIHTTGLGTIPFVAKLNSNGGKVWVTNASDNKLTGSCNAGVSGQAVILTTGGDAVITGGCGGLKWGAYQVPGACNTGYSAFTARFSSAGGAITALDTIARSNSGYGDFGTAIAAGNNNSVIIGGLMRNAQFVKTDTLVTAGGNSDFFIAKWGYPCNCILPTAGFTAAVTGLKTIQFTYTGTTTGIDSVVWNFGDGQQQKITSSYATPIAHTYAANGPYNASATVYSSCGSHTFSRGYALSIGNSSLWNGVSVYPNPVNDHLVIEGLEGGSYAIYNGLGQQMRSGMVSVLRQSIPTTAIPEGIYILRLISVKGVQSTMTFMKQ